MASSDITTLQKIFAEINKTKQRKIRPNKLHSFIIEPPVNIYKNYKEPNIKDELNLMETYLNNGCQCTPELFRCSNIYLMAQCKYYEEINELFPILGALINSSINKPINKIQLCSISAENIKQSLNNIDLQTPDTKNLRAFKLLFEIFGNFSYLPNKSYFYSNQMVRFVFIIGLLNSALLRVRFMAHKHFIEMAIDKIDDCFIYITYYQYLDKYFTGDVNDSLNTLANWKVQLKLLL
jgi:hypothetical protein